MIIKQYCRYKGIMCSLATEFGYCQVTACINREVRKNDGIISSGDSDPDDGIEIAHGAGDASD